LLTDGVRLRVARGRREAMERALEMEFWISTLGSAVPTAVAFRSAMN
jgi:hypothetical protein